MPHEPSGVHRYHDGTKHHFTRFARSLGYLDWASQPRPFRRFAGSAAFPLHPRPDAAGRARALGDLLRHALGLSAWKAYRDSRWSLRVNPSSGNLHPTEAYVICGPEHGLAAVPAVYHYASEQHELELRCEFETGAWHAVSHGGDLALVVLASIHWREAWKYGERAFRYCQHDMGHAIAAVAVAAALDGRRATLLPAWPQRLIASLAGLDRDEDFVDVEREEPGCLLALTGGAVPESLFAVDERLPAAIAAGRWQGRASQLSEDHVQWTFIDDVAEATRDPGRTTRAAVPPAPPAPPAQRSLILQRRSAVAFDGVSSTSREAFIEMLSAAMPGAGGPFAALWWPPCVHLALFVHRVDDVEPGLYMLVRDVRDLEPLQAAAERDFLWERVEGKLPLFLLARGDCRRLAARLSCDQDIAADGFFSLGMIVRFDASLEAYGPSFYRHLFWETGVVGQALYLAAEAAGARATGIGCFFDDAVHDALGLRGHIFQSLYHFTIGMPVDDSRLTSEPGYAWERLPDGQPRQS